jgi:hypothetical protein
MLSITSFNECMHCCKPVFLSDHVAGHEGTQIEPAVPRETASGISSSPLLRSLVHLGYHYIDYEGLSPNAYLEQTAALVQAFNSK